MRESTGDDESARANVGEFSRNQEATLAVADESVSQVAERGAARGVRVTLAGDESIGAETQKTRHVLAIKGCGRTRGAYVACRMHPLQPPRPTPRKKVTAAHLNKLAEEKKRADGGYRSAGAALTPTPVAPRGGVLRRRRSGW